MNNITKTIRKEYKAALQAQEYWEKQRMRNNGRGFIKECNFTAGQAHAIYELAQTLGVELYDGNIKLIED